jgi:hypothetical protein
MVMAKSPANEPGRRKFAKTAIDGTDIVTTRLWMGPRLNDSDSSLHPISRFIVAKP